MTATCTYKLNLRGIDVRDYQNNPIVLRRHDHMAPAIGRATIGKGKTTVEVTYFDQVPAYPHSLGTSIYTQNHERPVLVELSVIPVVYDSREDEVGTLWGVPVVPPSAIPVTVDPTLASYTEKPGWLDRLIDWWHRRSER